MRKPIPVRAQQLAIAIAAALFIGGPLFAQNGSVDFSTPLCGNSSQSAGIDLAYDTFTNTVWVLDEGSGLVCQYTLAAFPPDILFSQSVTHPAGASQGLPSFLPVGRGITYDPIAQNFVLLVFGDTSVSPPAPTLQLRRMDSTGLEVGFPVDLNTLPLGAAISGLAYDTISGNLWTRDTNNHQALELDPISGAVLTQVDLPGEAVMYGSGITFVNDGGVRTLEFTRGDVLDFAPAQLLRIDVATGNELCIEVDLTQVTEDVIGVIRPPTGTVIYATGETQIHKVDATIATNVPPRGLFCTNNTDGSLQLAWANCGNGIDGAYDQIRVRRNGAVIGIIAGNLTSYTDSDPLPAGGVVNYEVAGVTAGQEAATNCDLQTGAGGLVDYTIFDGIRPYDLALDPVAGEIYVTDNGSSFIYVYDIGLTQLVRVLDTGLPSLQGVAYNTVTNEVVVTRFNNVSMARVDPLTGIVLSNTPLGQNGDGVNRNTVAITYDALNDDYVMIDAAASPVEAFRINAETGSVGQLLGSWSPPPVTGLILGGGVCHIEFADSFLHPIHGGGNIVTSISELFGNGFPAGLAFPIGALGNSATEATNAARGLEDFANVLYIANPATRSIFRMLLAPGGADFMRGDANNDGVANISDVIFIASYIYQSGTAPGCLDAADVNDDGQLDISDPLYLLMYEFTSGAEPPAPFPTPGPDPTFLDPFQC